MARMNLRPRRDAPGVSVFWMILGLGAAVVLVIGIFLYVSGGETQVESGEPEIVAGEGDEAPGTSSFSEGEVAESETPPSLPGEAGEVDEGVPESGQADDSAGAGTAGAADADPAAPADGGEEPAE